MLDLDEDGTRYVKYPESTSNTTTVEATMAVTVTIEIPNQGEYEE